MFETQQDERKKSPRRGWKSTGRGLCPAVGDLLAEKYRLVRQIGEGGMATVYEAVHAMTYRRFAVKVLHPIHVNVDELRLRFECEAAVAGGLEHENIVSVLDFGYSDGGTPFIVMEYLAGEALFECLRREGPLPVTRAVDIVIQCCRGLAAAHALGIVHRDVKPENLFLCKHSDGSDLIKVLDFGIAKVRSNFVRVPETLASAEAECILGTPDYMCPEQAQAPATVDHRADIYGLGAVLFEALSGERPHPEKSFGAILDHLLTKAPERIDVLRPTLPRGLAEIVHRALAFDAADRFPSALEFAEALLPYGSDQATSEAGPRRALAPVRSSVATPVPTVRLPRRESVAFVGSLPDADWAPEAWRVLGQVA